MARSEVRHDAPARGGMRVSAADAERADRERWHELVSELGAAIAEPLTSALERVHALATTGKIDRAGLRALRDEIDRARQIGITGQQLTRFASGRIRQSHERLQLADVLQSVLTHRSREMQARGIVVNPVLKPAEVSADASLLFSLLNTTLDWALAHARAQVDFEIDARPWPAATRLSCRFAPHGDEPLDDGAEASPSRADPLTWRLVEQTAWTMGLTVERQDTDAHTALALEFPRKGSGDIDGVSATEIDEGFAPSANSQPLAGSHVLVIASRREMRVQIRDALRNMSLIVDFVNSVDEAASFCREGLPHAVIVEAIQNGERFAQFRHEIRAEVPDFVFIEIVEEGDAFEMSTFGGESMARVGRGVLGTSLPSALMFELSKSL
ncbi:MAG: hypothetical protein JSR59_23845 [Proteobacteria bacterium]|nr:hypothetical protein [Pseudomonadota bacterium]